MLGRTPREIREATKPRTFDYPVYYANNLLILAVGIAYSPIAPLVTLGCAAAFLASTCVDKYLVSLSRVAFARLLIYSQLMYVNTTKRESGGRSWRVVVNRFLFSLVRPLLRSESCLLTPLIAACNATSYANGDRCANGLDLLVLIVRQFPSHFRQQLRFLVAGFRP